ncbi:MAG: polysaccharide biosynthesis protein [Tannerellaceae bacterium]|jgi:FlaA1/EpsC-like NDP-sugar epimerase|nr:polysaccharide biosynthesis protein [Tannerellaceae bacterium]
MITQLRILFNRWIYNRYLNRWIIFGFDLLLSFGCTRIALLLVKAVLPDAVTLKTMVTVLFLSTMSSVASIMCLQIYKGIIRHSGFVEVGRIAMASLMKVVLIGVGILLTTRSVSVKFCIVECMADLFLTFFTLLVMRTLLIIIYHHLVDKTMCTKDNILVFSNNIGATYPGYLLQNVRENYHLSGFLKIGKKRLSRMGNYPIYEINNEEEFERLVVRHLIRGVLFPDYASVRREENRLIRYCEKRKIRMMVLPPFDDLKKGRINYRNIPEVKIEELLERDEIKINMNEIMQFLKGKAVLVTGAGGSIGSELCRQLCLFGVKELTLLDCAETPMHNLRLELEEKFPDTKCNPVIGNIRNAPRIRGIFERYKPFVVFHAAAYKHVPLMEENPCEAICTNVMGTMIVADASVEHGVEKFIMISSDKAVNPANVMGASKRLAEMYVQSLGIAISDRNGKTQFITTRFGNVLGSNGSVIPRFREQLLKGGPLTVTSPDIIRYFMTIPEACRLVFEAACMGEGNEIFVFDMGKEVKIDSLARRMIELAGFVPDKDIRIEYTGLRPGEKLFEELLASKESSLSTSNAKIFRAKVREYDYERLLPQILALCNVAGDGRVGECIAGMKELCRSMRQLRITMNVIVVH